MRKVLELDDLQFEKLRGLCRQLGEGETLELDMTRVGLLTSRETIVVAMVVATSLEWRIDVRFLRVKPNLREILSGIPTVTAEHFIKEEPETTRIGRAAFARH